VRREDHFNRYAEMTNHGLAHVEGVATLVSQLAGAIDFLTDSEKFVLLAVAYLHDVGMYETSDYFYSDPFAMRKLHGPLSRERIRRDRHLLLPTLAENDDAVELIALLCSYHQKRAALSTAERKAIRDILPSKRMRYPGYLKPDRIADYLKTGRIAEVCFDKLPDQPSLQEELESTERSCFSLQYVSGEGKLERLPNDDGICPFRLATLIKLLDGMDFHASRTGSIEALLRHTDRNQSHARRSQRIAKDCGEEFESHKRAQIERSYFRGSFFHFIRNLLIERTVIVKGQQDRQVEVVIKPADPDEILKMCRRVGGVKETATEQTVAATGSVQETLAIIERYQTDPVETIKEGLGDFTKQALEGFLEEFDVEVPKDSIGDRRTVHALIAKRYIEAELDAVEQALDSGKTEGAYCYCGVCPNNDGCQIRNKSKRAMPTFREGEAGEKKTWNVGHFHHGVHVPRLALTNRLPAAGSHSGGVDMPRRTESIQWLKRQIQEAKQLLLFGPRGRRFRALAREAAIELVPGNHRRLLWHEVQDGEDQVDAAVQGLARFLAANGEYALENLIREEDITPVHADYALDFLRSGRLQPSKAAFVLCVGGFNRLETTSRRFFRDLMEAFVCASCPEGASCDKQPGKRWCCGQATSYSLALSSKKPGRSWEKTTGGIPITAVAAPAASLDEMRAAVKQLSLSEELIDHMCEVWRAYGSEPFVIERIASRCGAKGGPEHQLGLVEKDVADFFEAHFGARDLGGETELRIMQLVALLSGCVTTKDIENVFGFGSHSDEGPLEKLVDRGLVHREGDRLAAHAAWVSGHHRSRWVDRVADHPWPLLVGLVGCGTGPAETLRQRWTMVAPYLPELARLELLPGGSHHRWNPLAHSLMTLATLDELVSTLDTLLPDRSATIREHLEGRVRVTGKGTDRDKELPWREINRLGLLRVAALFHDIGKYDNWSTDGTRVSFVKHESAGRAKWLEVATSFAMPDSQRKYVAELIAGHMHAVVLLTDQNPSDKAIAHFVHKQRAAVDELLLLGFADLLAGDITEDQKPGILAVMNRVYSKLDEVEAKDAARKGKRVTSNDLFQLGMKQGKSFGQAMNAADLAGREMPDLTDDQLKQVAQRVYESSEKLQAHEILKLARDIRGAG
jgi:hypothetical protein